MVALDDSTQSDISHNSHWGVERCEHLRFAGLNLFGKMLSRQGTAAKLAYVNVHVIIDLTLHVLRHLVQQAQFLLQ